MITILTPYILVYLGIIVLYLIIAPFFIDQRRIRTNVGILALIPLLIPLYLIITPIEFISNYRLIKKESLYAYKEDVMANSDKTNILYCVNKNDELRLYYCVSDKLRLYIKSDLHMDFKFSEFISYEDHETALTSVSGINKFNL